MQNPEACASVGAMTHSFIKAVECEPRGVTYGRLLTTMKAIMTNGGGSCDLQGPIGAPVRKVANFSGVQVRAPATACSFPVLLVVPDKSCVTRVAGAKPVLFGDVRHLPQALRAVSSHGRLAHTDYCHRDY